jgi:hypothetical protein
MMSGRDSLVEFLDELHDPETHCPTDISKLKKVEPPRARFVLAMKDCGFPSLTANASG